MNAIGESFSILWQVLIKSWQLFMNVKVMIIRFLSIFSFILVDSEDYFICKLLKVMVLIPPIDHRVKEICDYESDLISLLRDLTMSSALDLCFMIYALARLCSCIILCFHMSVLLYRS